MLKKYVIFVFLLFSISSIFSIDIVVGNKDFKNVTESRNFDNDLLIAGDYAEFSGKAKALYIFGKDILMSGNLSDSLITAGKDIEITGKVDNHIYAIARKINIRNQVTGTSFLAAEDIIIDKNSVINGDIFIGAATIKILGTINGNLYGGADKIIIQGVINGNVKLGVTNLTIPEEGRINGNLSYTSDKEISKSELEKIRGKTEFKKSEPKHEFSRMERNKPKSFRFMGIFFSIFMLLSFGIAGILINLLPSAKSFEISRTNKEFWNHLLWGLIPFFIYPVAVLFLIIFGITFPLGITLFLAGLPLLLMTQLFGATLLGQFLFKNFKWNKNNRILYFLTGALIYAIFIRIPFIGLLTTIFFSSIGWGYIISIVFKRKLIDTNIALT